MEWEYILRYLPLVMQLDDCELVGEFLQCMKLMQYDERGDRYILSCLSTSSATINPSCERRSCDCDPDPYCVVTTHLIVTNAMTLTLALTLT